LSDQTHERSKETVGLLSPIRLAEQPGQKTVEDEPVTPARLHPSSQSAASANEQGPSPVLKENAGEKEYVYLCVVVLRHA